jgi:iron complex transport system substrate-binding protein
MRKIKFLFPVFFAIIILWRVFSHDACASQSLPKRIVSLAPSMTEELYLLGAEDSLIANTTYCVTPHAAGAKEKIGDITKINLEKIVSLKPDLVLATSLTNSKAIQKLKNLGIEVMIFPAPKNYAYLCDQFLELGKAVGKEAQAKAIIAESKERVTAIRARTAELAKPKVFIEIGAKPLFTANKDYFINDFVELAGGVNIAQDAKVGTYSREEVLRKNADLIIIVMMGLAVKKETEVWQKFKDLNAVRDNRIYIIDSRKVCSPTPVTFVETLNEIASLLHPELSRGKQ